jgi:MFS superfamily sulfate permease-like transporter
VIRHELDDLQGTFRAIDIRDLEVSLPNHRRLRIDTLRRPFAQFRMVREQAVSKYRDLRRALNLRPRRVRTFSLGHDIVAGLVLTTMLVPVGIAYAVASGVPGIYGLYATIVPLLTYALFGPSRILVLGPDSSLAALIFAVVVPLSGGDSLRAIALASISVIGQLWL